MDGRKVGPKVRRKGRKIMALTAADLEGFTAEVEDVPSKTQGVSVSQIPDALVKLLAAQTPKVKDVAGKEIILRMPVNAPEPTPLADDATKEQRDAHKEQSDARAKAEKAATDTVKQLCLYAAAWGKGQDPKLYIHKVMNRKDMPAWHARLSVQSWDKVPADNRPGRRTSNS